MSAPAGTRTRMISGSEAGRDLRERREPERQRDGQRASRAGRSISSGLISRLVLKSIGVMESFAPQAR